MRTLQTISSFAVGFAVALGVVAATPAVARPAAGGAPITAVTPSALIGADAIARYQRLDADGDGVLSDDEVDAGRTPDPRLQPLNLDATLEGPRLYTASVAGASLTVGSWNDALASSGIKSR